MHWSFSISSRNCARSRPIPVLSRIILLLETVGGLIFLIWFIRARRRSGPLTTSNKTARVAGSIAVAGFGAIIVADLLATWPWRIILALPS